MTYIKNFFPDADIIQVKTETHEIVVHRSPEGEVFVDVREFATDIETNLILGKGELVEEDDDLDGNPFAKQKSEERKSRTCELCTEPLAFIVPGIPHEADMFLCNRHATQMDLNRVAFSINHNKKDVN